MARQMKDSGIEWIGEIPETWDLVQLKRFATVNNGREIEAEVDGTTEGAIGVYGSGGVFKYTDRYMHDGVAVMFGRKGTLGKPLYVDNKFWVVDTMYYLTYTEALHPKFNYYQLMVFDWNPHITQTALPSVVASQIVAKHFPIPTIKEQQRIASFLDRKCAEIDAVIERTKATIEEYKKLKQVVITEAVTKGVRGARKMKDSGIEWIGEIPEEWSIRKLFRAIDAIGDIDHYMPESVETGIPYLMTGDLRENASQVHFERCKQVSSDDFRALSAKIKACKGDVIFARYATIGTVCYADVDKEFLVSYSCLTIKPTHDLLLGKFLFYYLKSTSFYEDVRQYINSNTQANVGLDSMTKAKIVLPSVCEQEEIIKFLDEKCAALDTLIAKKTALLTELENYKKSLIYEYVTGKKEV